MSAEKLFFISMSATWLILFYHVFLTVGGYKHFLKTMHDDDQDMRMEYYPFVSVLVPAHNEDWQNCRSPGKICLSERPL